MFGKRAAWPPPVAAAALWSAASIADLKCAAEKPTTKDHGYSVVARIHNGAVEGRLAEGRDGRLIGVCPEGGEKAEGGVFSIRPDGSDFKWVHSFRSMLLGGVASGPRGVVEGSDGRLYGTTQYGGRANGALTALGLGAFGDGTVFSMAGDGSDYRELHRFMAEDGEGIGPMAGLTRTAEGALFGASFGAGILNNKAVSGAIFQLEPNGAGFRVIHRFASTPDDGGAPFATMIQGRDGSLYGVTDGGGSSMARNGTVFTFKTDGTGYRILHSFPSKLPNGIDGRMPRTTPLEGRDGSLFGTTSSGGEHDQGVVFRMSRDGKDFRVLHEFNAATGLVEDPNGFIEAVVNGKPGHFRNIGDGRTPQELAQLPDGTLLGTTEDSGPNGGGTVFRMEPDGTGFTTLHAFPSSTDDGVNPHGPLVLGKDGAIYGLCARTRDNQGGMIFKIVPGGAK
jgi:uncharacterized repeat protein (TIGR03803 family)